jgi:hypothetical protein
MSSLFPVYPQIACALVLFLASFAFPPHFLRPDSQRVTAVAGGVTAENLQVASATNPTGIDRQTPSLSWELRATLPEAHDLGQSSYRILVASSAEELAEDRGSLWDSGRVQSSQRLYVTHCGRPLTSHQSYYWKVRVWDQVGKASGWSAGKVDDGNPTSGRVEGALDRRRTRRPTSDPAQRKPGELDGVGAAAAHSSAKSSKGPDP